MHTKVNRQALGLALIVIIAAALWILISNQIFPKPAALGAGPETSVILGCALLLGMGGAVYLACRQLLRTAETVNAAGNDRPPIAPPDTAGRGPAGKRQREPERLYRQLFDVESDAVLVADCETGQLLDLNQSALRLYGYSEDEFIRLRLQDISAGPELDLGPAGPGGAGAPQSWHRKKNGEPFAVEITASRFEYHGREIDLVAVRDITGRRLAEEELRESEEKYRGLVENFRDAVVTVDPATGKFTSANPAAVRMFDAVNEAALLGLSPADLSPERQPDGSLSAELIKRKNAVPDSQPFEWTHRRVSGGEFFAEVLLAKMERAGKTLILSTIREITERKLDEAKLRESEARYRQLFDLSSDAVLLFDHETRRVVDANESAQKLYGYTRAEFLNLTIDAVSAEPEEAGRIAGANKGVVLFQWHRHRQGDRFAVEITTNLILYQGRKTELASVRDITSRQKVMQMLSETTDQLLEAQNVAGLGSYAFDVKAGFWTGSEVLGKVFGLANPGSPRTVDDWMQIIHPQDRGEMRRHLADDVLRDRRPFDRIYRIIRPGDSEVRWVHGLGRLAFDDHGEIIRMTGVIQDVTEHKLAEEKMNVQLSALTAADHAIVITDCRGAIEWVNPAFVRLTGFSAKEAVGNNFRMLKSGQHPHAFYANLWATILTGNVWHGEFVNRRKDGRFYTEDTAITPVRGADGQIAHFVAIKQDITNRRQLEKRVQQAQKMEAIGTLAGGIAHDFNNILAAMFGYVSLLQQDTENIPAAQESLAEVLKAAGRAKELVQQILTFSRQTEQKAQIIQIDPVVREAVKFLRASMPAQIKIDLNLAPDVPAIQADPTQIYQVIINLATNSLHAMEDRPGLLGVSLECFNPDPDFIRSHPDFRSIPYAQLTVSDTGHGMNAAVMERIFEPFFTTKPVGHGTGLGLSVVHGIVQSHHGVITVESEVGRGATFRLYFPGHPKDTAVAAAVDHPAPRGNGQKILLLDDEPELTAALQRLLVRLNYQVVTTTSSREAILWCRNDPARFDLILTDLTMPDMSGLEVARELHALRPTLPVILTSGFCADIDRETMKAAGICELLEKPVSRTLLANAVQRSLAGSNGQTNGQTNGHTNGNGHTSDHADGARF